MKTGVYIDQKDIDRLTKGFNVLPDEMKVKNLQDGVSNLATAVKNTAKPMVPVESGRLLKAISKKKIIKRYQVPDQIRYLVYIKFITDSPQCKRNKDARVASKCEAYGKFVHQGHKTRGGGFIPENPFLLKALQQVKPQAKSIVQTGMLKGMDRLVRKVFGKGVTWS